MVHISFLNATFRFLVFALFWLAAMAMAFAFPSSAALAQSVDDGLHIITSPLPINLVTEPGGTISTPLKVKNGGIHPETLKISLMKFKAYEENGQPQLLDPEPGDDFLQWVHFSEEVFTLAPDEWKTIHATFTVPESAAFGYYYAIVFSRAENSKTDTSDHQTAVVGGSAVLTLLEVKVPHAKRLVEITEFTTDRKWYEFLPVTFSVKLKNTGNVHIAPRGNIFISQGDNHDGTFLEINPGKGNILPDSARNFEAVWKDGFPVYEHSQVDGKVLRDDEGRPLAKLTWDWREVSKLRWGKYTAKMLLVYDDGQRDIPLESQTSFWVIPWRLIGALLLLALFVFIGLKAVFIQIWRKFFSLLRKH